MGQTVKASSVWLILFASARMICLMISFSCAFSMTVGDFCLSLFLCNILVWPGRVLPLATYPLSSPGSQLPYVVHVNIYPIVLDIVGMV